MARQRVRSEFELLWYALERRLPASVSDIHRAGVLGELVQGASQPPLAGDLIHLWIPGMAALDIEARLVPLPPEGREQAFPTHRATEILLFGFAAPPGYTPPEEIDDSTPLPGNTDPQITAQALLVESTPEGFYWHNADGVEEQATALPSRFSYALALSKSLTKAPRRAGVQAALHRWLAWHAAYPERAPREEDRTDPNAEWAAAFLRETIGTRHDLLSNRLRYAAECFEAALIEQAYRWLLEAAIAAWQLPAAPAEALRASPERPLSDMSRRELIYFARAGSLPLKTLAARRLSHECEHLDARKTLHQLRFDLHPWVRAAARSNQNTQED